jgi:hypothetical protein
VSAMKEPVRRAHPARGAPPRLRANRKDHVKPVKIDPERSAIAPSRPVHAGRCGTRQGGLTVGLLAGAALLALGGRPADGGPMPGRDGAPGPDVDTTADAVDDLVSTADAPDAATNCGALATCGACAAAEGCGWCLTRGRCLTGDSNGSADGTCSGAAWDFTGDLCTAPGADAGGAADVATGSCVPTVARGGENTNALTPGPARSRPGSRARLRSPPRTRSSSRTSRRAARRGRARVRSTAW